MTVGSTRSTLAEAYAECARITRERARNFHYGIRLLPADKRAALSVVYAFARRADDIGDDPTIDPDEKSLQLAELRQQLADLASGSADPVLFALDDVSKRYPLPLEVLAELIDGIEMDVRGTTYETFDELVIYCRRVAGTVGRLSLAIFGSAPNPDAPALADRLGIALQQTNILRDIREDLINGRVYIPSQDLDRFGVTLKLDEFGQLDSQAGGFEAMVQASTARAEEWYVQGLRLLDLLDRRSFACCAAMSGIYHRLNSSIASEPGLVRGQRASLSGREKAGVAVRSLVGVRP
jgi:15-cis-phytoene synthase